MKMSNIANAVKNFFIEKNSNKAKESLKKAIDEKAKKLVKAEIKKKRNISN
jgi:hypothetical protein